MSRPIRSKDGKFAGSVGEGASRVPVAAPVRPAAAATGPLTEAPAAADTVSQAYQTYTESPASPVSIEYMYRDASNWKSYETFTLDREFTEDEKAEIVSLLKDREFFVPQAVGLDPLQEAWGEDDHPWHEMHLDEATPAPADHGITMTAEDFLSRCRTADWDGEAVRVQAQAEDW